MTGLRLLGADRDGDVVLARYDYDGAGRLIAVTDTSGVALRLEYDPAGRIVGWHDRNGTVYRYSYDARGRVVWTRARRGAWTARCATTRSADDDGRRLPRRHRKYELERGPAGGPRDRPARGAMTR